MEKIKLQDLQKLVDRLNSEVAPGFSLICSDLNGFAFGLNAPKGYVSCDAAGLAKEQLYYYMVGILNFKRASKNNK